MRVVRYCTLTLLLLGGAASVGEAQNRGPREHRGFWISFGPGVGVNASEELDGESLFGGALFMRLGGTPHRRFLLGGEVIGWLRDHEGSDLARGNTTFTLMFYPSDEGGFYAKAGLGIANLETETTVLTPIGPGTVSDTKTGFGSTFGAGYDIRLTRNFYLSPTVDWLFQAFDETVGGTSTNHLILFTIGATWH